MVGGVVIDVVADDGCTVLRLGGELSVRTAPRIRLAVEKLLRDGRDLAVDLSALRCAATAAVAVFPAALAAAGGWPGARMVLFAASPAMAAALRSSRVPRSVPLVADLPAAVVQVHRRPRCVRRQRALPAHPTAPRTARRFAAWACADWDVDPDRADDAAIVVTELVANAVDHARTSCVVSVALTARGLRLAVRDFRPGPAPRPPPPDPLAPRGRGLQVVAALAATWGASTHDDGKTVWAVLAPGPTS